MTNINRNNLSLAINIIGTLIAVTGAICNSIGIYRYAFGAWIISNGMLLVLFWGVERKWWELNSGALVQCGLYAVYMITSMNGFLRVG
jgi:hypothetical protein